MVKYVTDNNLWDDNNEGLYGTGDGTTTFRLPNLIGRFFEPDATSGILKAAGLPNIEGSFSLRYGTSSARLALSKRSAINSQSISAETSYALASVTGTLANTAQKLSLDASQSSAIYSNSVTTVQPKSITLIPCIKY